MAALLLLLEESGSALVAEHARYGLLRESLPIVATQWFMTLWAGSLPLPSLLRTWDLMLSADAEGGMDAPSAAGATLGAALCVLQLGAADIGAAQAEGVAGGGDPSTTYLALERATRQCGDSALCEAMQRAPLRNAPARQLRAVARRRCEAAGTLAPAASASGSKGQAVRLSIRSSQWARAAVDRTACRGPSRLPAPCTSKLAPLQLQARQICQENFLHSGKLRTPLPAASRSLRQRAKSAAAAGAAAAGAAAAAAAALPPLFMELL